jgi:hypothetical protein
MSDKNLMPRARVSVAGRAGNVIDVADKVQVKFDDGSVGFYAEAEVQPVVEDTRLKTMQNGQVLFHSAPSSEDPLAQPRRITGRSLGDAAAVLGRN